MPEEITPQRPAEDTPSPDTPAIPENAHGDDLLEIIKNVEAQLAQLKEARTDQERMYQAMLEQQSELERQDHALADRAARIDERTERIESQERDASARDAELDHKAAELASAEQELAEQGRSLAQREEELTVREREVLLQQSTFEDQFTEILEQAQRFKTELAEFSKSRAEQENELKHLSARAEKLQADLGVVEDEREVLVADNTRLRGELESARAAGTADSTGAIDQLRDSLAQRDEHIERLMSRLDEATHESAQIRDALGSTEEHGRELHDALAELESLRAEVAESYRAAEQVEQLRAENAALREQIEHSPDETPGLAALREQIEGAAPDESALDAADAGLQQLAELLSSERVSPEVGAALNEEIATQRARADAARADAEELRQSLEHAAEQIAALEKTAEPGDAAEQIAKRDKVIEQLTTQLKESETHRAARVSRVSPELAQLEKTRRERLKAMRNSLRDKATRLAQANEMIDKRQAECEQILKLRSELVAGREALERDRNQVARGSTKAGAGVTAACAAVALLALAPLSWKAAGVYAPAEHLATSALSIQTRDGSIVGPESAGRFQTLVSDLVQDPQLVEQAATRMGRRGIDQYADPAALSSAMHTHLDVSFPAETTAEITYTDRGGLLTQRTLETVLASLVSAANSRSAARLDNTTVVVTAAPDKTTIVNLRSQAVVAAGVWAGSSFVVLVFFALVAMGLTKARERIRSEESLLKAARDGSGIGWGQSDPSGT